MDAATMSVVAACAGLMPVLGAVSRVVCRWVMVRAGRWGLMDRPGGRKRHARETPRSGGLGFVSVMLAALLAGLAVSSAGAVLHGWLEGWGAVDAPALGYLLTASGRAWSVGVLCAAVLALLVVGLLDDRRGCSAWCKLAAQVAVAVLVVYVGEVRLTAFLPWGLAGVLTVVWLVLMCNALNFLDHADGLAASTALVGCVALGVVSMVHGQYFVPLLAACIAGPLAGFLWWNLPPARLFMGDAGSQPLGLLLGVLAVFTTYTADTDGQAARVLPLLTPLLVFALPLYDAGYTLWCRARRGASLLSADDGHLGHRLARGGLGPRGCLAVVVLLSVSAGAAGISLQWLEDRWAWLAVLQVGCGLAVLTILQGSGDRRSA